MQWLLLKLQWKKFFRAPGVERELFQKILVAVIALVIFVQLGIVAFHLPEIMEKVAKQMHLGPVGFINTLLLSYFISELFIRFIFQGNPLLDLRPLLLEPLKKQKLAQIILFRSLFHPFNILALLLFGPFTFRVLLPQYGSTAAWSWYLGVVFISWGFHFLMLMFRQRLMEKFWVWALILGLAIVGYWLQFSMGFKILTPFQKAFESLINEPAFILAPVLFLLMMLFLAQRFTVYSLYEEEDTASKGKSRYAFHFLDKGDVSSAFYQQELRLIFRNKRSRSTVILAGIFLFYGLIFFTNPTYDKLKGFYLFIGIFVSGIFTINYGQFLWSWLTNTVTFYFMQPVTLREWVKVRYRFLVGACLIFTVLSTPYLYFGFDKLLAVLVGGIYNIGVNIPLMMRLSLWDPKPIDLTRSPMMNYQGTGAAQWIMGIPIIGGPLLLYAPFGIYFSYQVGVLVVGAVGLIGYLLHPYFLRKITAAVDEKRYYLINKLKI